MDILAGESIPSYRHVNAAQLLKAARYHARLLGIKGPTLLEKQGECVFFPWTGTRGMTALVLCARADGMTIRSDSLSITYEKSDPAAVRTHLEKVASSQFNLMELAARLDIRHRDKFDQFLPDELIDLTNTKRALSLDDASRVAREALGG